MSYSLNSFKDIVSYINTIESEDKIKDFVMSRLENLESNSKKKNIDKVNDGLLIGTITEGYINSESPISSSFLVDPFYMNDATLYIEFIKSIKGKNLNNPLQFFHELQNFTVEAFGFKGNQAIRESVYLEERNSEISIADFYKNNSALCTERSASVQNLAEFCGIKSYLVFGKLYANEKETEHAFNIFQMRDGTLILFDATNPITLNNGCYVPAYSIIGKDDISNIESIAFDYEKLCKIYNQPIHQDEPLDRNYITCNYYLKNENNELK